MSAASTRTDPAIAVRDLSYRYDSASEPALQNIGLRIEKGRCFGLLGPNGAGKTTLLSILTGILPKQSGSVSVLGHPLGSHPAVKRLSAIVPQDFAFYPSLSGLENLIFFAGLQGLGGAAREERIVTVTEVCQLREVLHKPAEAYSGGLKRRLNLAIGLLNEPDILYLDEPTVGIDAQSRKFILKAIKALKAGGMTVVYTSHYMEEVQAICDDLAIIDHGRVVLHSGLSELLDEQAQLVELTFREEPSSRQIAALASLGECKLTGTHLRLHLSAAEMDLSALLKRLEHAGLTPRQIQYGINRLEDVYLSITKDQLRE